MPEPNPQPRRKWLPDLSAWGFSRYERRALWFLTALIIVGAGYRFWRQQKLELILRLWVTPADSSAAAAIVEFNSPTPVIQPLNINNTTAAELELLPGLGPKKAEAITAYRDQRGGFRSLDELDSVPGIGPKTLERLRPFLRLADSPIDTASDVNK